jgi:hypothetical protein
VHVLGLLLVILGFVWVLQGAILGGILVMFVGFVIGGVGLDRRGY